MQDEKVFYGPDSEELSDQTLQVLLTFLKNAALNHAMTSLF